MSADSATKGTKLEMVQTKNQLVNTEGRKPDLCDLRVKICGITSLADAREATNLGANILGFNFYRPSPRYIEPQKCAEIINALSAERRPRPLFAGVFVNATKDEVGEIIQTAPLDVLQFHGDETPEYCQTWPAFVTIKALRLSEERVIHPTFQKDLATYLYRT